MPSTEPQKTNNHDIGRAATLVRERHGDAHEGHTLQSTGGPAGKTRFRCSCGATFDFTNQELGLPAPEPKTSARRSFQERTGKLPRDRRERPQKRSTEQETK